MSSAERKQKLTELIAEYNKFKKQGKLDLTSEETIRTWLNELLAIFDWDVRDTSQILQEKVLSKAEKEKLKIIRSQNTRPDYTFRVAKQKLTFLDAKDISVRILTDLEAAFQIKSYGWSILAPCAFISNFEELAIHDCTYTPEQGQDPALGRLYLSINDYIINYDILETHLLKENIYKGKLNEIYSASLKDNKYIEKITPDLKFAKLPAMHDLQAYDCAQAEGMPPAKLQQLKELTWLDQNFNLVIMGPNGVGKSLLAAGLCHHALENGYRAYFRTMEQIMTALKTKDISRSGLADYKKLYKAHLIIIDDIMMIAIERQEANAFFHFINALHERTSFIITTNKSPKEWAETIGDEVITTALLDRLLYRCEIIKLSGESYRMKHRKTIFEKTK
jgi:DNA replication protein DnaC